LATSASSNIEIEARKDSIFRKIGRNVGEVFQLVERLIATHRKLLLDAKSWAEDTKAFDT
jgi:hypothetical protein